MLAIGDKPVYLCCKRTDMRKSINGLTAAVKGAFDLDPFSGAIFVFCNRAGNMIKALEWDVDGFWLHFKRLERGRLSWPRPDSEGTIALSGEELAVLIDSAKLQKKLRRNELPDTMAV